MLALETERTKDASPSNRSPSSATLQNKSYTSYRSYGLIRLTSLQNLYPDSG